VHPEAGFRDFSDNEWNSYVENEKSRLIAAGSLESTLSRVTQIDASVGSEAKTRALIAMLLSFAGIIAYLWVRFGTARYGLAAVVALSMTVLITLATW
jgi:SecD/SecF fusion protein